jgi:hypothetical protein
MTVTKARILGVLNRVLDYGPNGLECNCAGSNGCRGACTRSRTLQLISDLENEGSLYFYRESDSGRDFQGPYKTAEERRQAVIEELANTLWDVGDQLVYFDQTDNGGWVIYVPEEPGVMEDGECVFDEDKLTKCYHFKVECVERALSLEDAKQQAGQSIYEIVSKYDGLQLIEEWYEAEEHQESKND